MKMVFKELEDLYYFMLTSGISMNFQTVDIGLHKLQNFPLNRCELEKV